jgi:hypothetical protein
MSKPDNDQGFAEAFKALQEKPDVDNFLVLCETDDCGPPPVRILFPRFKEDGPDIPKLAEWLCLQAVNFVIPIRKRKAAQQAVAASATAADMSFPARLAAETRRAFLDYNAKYPHRASEVAELLAYLLALRYLNAAQLASKMALKTNTNMPIHGLDGIHASFQNGIMTLYFVEAKLAASAKSGTSDYVDSLAAFWLSRTQYLLENHILSDLGNLDALSDTHRDMALEYLDVYGTQSSQRLERSIGVVCFSETTHFNNKLPKGNSVAPSNHEKHYASNYSKEHGDLHAYVRERLESKGIDPEECELFYVAVPNVDKLRELFYEQLQ